MRSKALNNVIPIGHEGALEVFRNLEALFVIHPTLSTVLSWNPWKLSLAYEWLKNVEQRRPRFLRRYR